MPSGSQDRTPNPRLQIALELHRSGRLQEAEREYRRVLEVRPEDADAVHLLGLVHAASGWMEGAAACFERVVALDPDGVEARRNLGLALQRLGRLEDSAIHYRRVLERVPADFEVCNNLGTILLEPGDPEGAETYLRKALDLKGRLTGMARRAIPVISRVLHGSPGKAGRGRRGDSPRAPEETADVAHGRGKAWSKVRGTVDSPGIAISCRSAGSLVN